MRLLMDTCVWFNFLENEKTIGVLDTVLDLMEKGSINLVVPQQVINEIERNTDSVLKKRKDAMKTFRKHAAKLKAVLSNEHNTALDSILSEVDKVIPNIDAEIDESFAIVKRVLYNSKTIRLGTTDNIKIRASDRGLLKLAPFNKGAKNSMGDAIILEAAFDLQRTNPTEPLYFITTNPDDFSDSTDKKKPHKDIENDFATFNILYSISPGDAIEEISKLPIPDETKSLFHYINYYHIALWNNETPSKCYECGNELIFKGYRVLRGYAGALYVCEACGVMHHVIDADY